MIIINEDKLICTHSLMSISLCSSGYKSWLIGFIKSNTDYIVGVFIWGKCRNMRKYSNLDESTALCRATENVLIMNGLECKMAASSSKVWFVYWV